MDPLADLWVASWQETMPNIDFSARRDWLVNHISTLEAAGAITICALDHDDFGSNRSKIMNVIDFIQLERDTGGKPAQRSTFPHPALEPPNRIVGFVTLNAATGWLDQLAVAPAAKGAGAAERLIEEAKRLSPRLLALDVNVDNPRALRFYEKEGFVTIGEGVNPMSGLKTLRLVWQGAARGPSRA
jgi:putative acetyltransferase